MTLTISHIDDLTSTRTPLTIISGVGPAIADKLKAGGVITVMAMSMIDPKRLTPLGITIAQAKKAVKSAQDIVDIVTSGNSIQAETQDTPETGTGKSIILNGREVQITKEDFENAEKLSLPVEDYMLLDDETRTRELRIHNSMYFDKDAPEIDHGAEEFDMGVMGAPEFIKSRIKNEVNAMQEAGRKKIITQEKTASFVAGIVHGEDVNQSQHNVNPVKVDPNPSEEDLETDVYIHNRRNQETRLQAQKRQKDGVDNVINNLLG